MTAAQKKISSEIQDTEAEIMRLSQKLADLRREAPLVPVPNYTLQDERGPVTLEQLFAGKDILFAIHNMGQACRYCTLWADGFNGFVPHLEDCFAVVLLSKDAPDVQRRFANERGWRFRMASHGGGAYIQEQGDGGEGHNAPGLVCYERRDGKIFRKNTAQFGPNDAFCAIWPMLGMAGVGWQDWTPQYSYWKRPAKMDDGGENLR